MTDREWYPLDSYTPPRPARLPRLRKLGMPAAAVLGMLVLVGSVQQLADAAWKRGDPAPVVLPNTVPRPTATPAPYPFGRRQVVEKAPRSGYDLPGQQSDPTLSGLAPR